LADRNDLKDDDRCRADTTLKRKIYFKKIRSSGTAAQMSCACRQYSDRLPRKKTVKREDEDKH